MDNTVVKNNEKKECRITWFIENYSYCWHNNGEKLASPEFTADGLNGTKWQLNLFPRGQTDKSGNNICLFVYRSRTDNGPESMPLKLELSVLASDGSVLQSKECEHTFKKGNGLGYHQFAQMHEVLLRRKADFLPQDRLCVLCNIWKGEGNVQSVTHFRAVTRIRIEHISFLHIVEGFSSLKPNEKKTIEINFPLEDEFLSSSLHFCDDSCCKGKIMVEIEPFSTDQTLAKCKLSILDGSGKFTECSAVDNRFNCIREDIKKLPLSLTKTVLLNRKCEYLPDDKLTLLCDCTFSTEIEFDRIESTLHQLPLSAVNLISNNDQNKDTYAAKKLSACPSVQDDFKAIYNNLFLTDVDLKTKTKSFPAHKIVLCARSSVFKVMLTSDMKEKIVDCILVDDLENDTVQELLLFLYSDYIENLQWESAIKLYYAGDKYNIEKLKLLCSSFLLDNLSTSNAIELLLLADMHNDSDLRKFVENFILENEEEVFGSDEWEKLMEINPQLVSRTMHLKYKRNIKKVNET